MEAQLFYYQIFLEFLGQIIYQKIQEAFLNYFKQNLAILSIQGYKWSQESIKLSFKRLIRFIDFSSLLQSQAARSIYYLGLATLAVHLTCLRILVVSSMSFYLNQFLQDQANYKISLGKYLLNYRLFLAFSNVESNLDWLVDLLYGSSIHLIK